MTLAQLRERRQELLAEMTEIQAAVKTAGGKFTDDQRARLKVLGSEDDQAKEQVAQIESDLELSSRIDSRISEVSRVTGRRTSPDSSRSVPKSDKEAEWLADPMGGFKDHREFLQAVIKAGSGYVDDRLRLRMSGSGGPQQAVGSDEQGTFSDPYGGVLIPKGMSPTLLRIDSEGDPTAAYVTNIPMTTTSLSIGARTDKTHTSSVSGGLQVYRRAEADAAISSRMELEQVELKAVPLMGLAYATEEVLGRSPISFVALLEAGFSDEFNAKMLKEKLLGTGAGQMEGVVNAPCVVSIAKESGQAAATLNADNIIKMRARCWGYGKAIWLANHDTLPQLMKMNMSVGTGGSAMIWQPSMREDAPDMLLGRPLFFSEFLKTLGTTGDIILGNWSQYLVGTLSGVQNAESIHVRFVNHERAFKFWMENDGRCWWRTALTVNQGSNTLSPFVKLDTR